MVVFLILTEDIINQTFLYEALSACIAKLPAGFAKVGIFQIEKKCTSIDLMHKSWSGPCILGNRNLRIIIGHSLQGVTNNNA